MYKNLLKIFGAGSIVLSGVSLNTAAVDRNSFHIKEKNNIIEKQQQVQDSTTWQSFITVDSSNLMFYGRVLKYYLANMVEYNDGDMNLLGTWWGRFENFIGKEYLKNLIIQNLVASTINISLYGSTSDAEFYAEAFSKWMLTPDELKNKSWEVLNNFFLEILPVLHNETKGSLTNNSSKIQNVVTRLISENTSWAKYDLTLSSVPINEVDLKYATNQIGWKGVEFRKLLLGYILSGLNWRISDLDYNDFNDTFNEILSGWMNDSFTPASENSIKKFEDANENHFQNFKSLDEKLAEVSKDSEGFSQVNLINSLSAIEEEYILNQPTDYTNSNFLRWTSDTTVDFQNTLLKMYNYLYYLTGSNETNTLNLSSALIFAADTSLIGFENSTMGVQLQRL